MEKTFTEAEKRVLKIAEYILDTKCTHKRAGEYFGVTVSYITNLMKHKLPVIDPDIAEEVSKVGKGHNIDKGAIKEVHDQHMPRLEEGAPS
jgi:hypothetical protein